MSNRKDLKLDKYEISPRAYRELYYFCLQYGEMREKLKNIYTSVQNIKISTQPHGTDLSDETPKRAIAASKLRRNIEMIERSARLADDEIDGYLLKNVTEEMSYTYLRNSLGMPCGRTKFYRARRKFFYLLDNERKKI